MDAESLAQIEQIVATAVSGAEARFRNETGTLTASPQQGLGESMGALATSFRKELAEKIEDLKRHNRAYAEDLCRKLDLVIDGQRGLHADLDHLAATIDRAFRETQALIRSMMGQSNR